MCLWLIYSICLRMDLELVYTFDHKQKQLLADYMSVKTLPTIVEVQVL